MDAANYAISLAQQYNADLIALTEQIRYEYDERIDYGGIAELPRQEIEEKSFIRIKEKCKEKGVRLSTQVVTGKSKSAALEIVDYAESNNVDLIVVGNERQIWF
jgi:nucleotide-binding universal stress UspA family protein